MTIQEQQDIQKVQQDVEDAFLQFRNVTGIGAGIQQVNGVMTGTPFLLVFVGVTRPKKENCTLRNIFTYY
ncbi:hypothetical protein P4409_22135 [Bacillus thuringiensis]|nr:hypothetical protein [Bacillus thuringiensis]